MTKAELNRAIELDEKIENAKALLQKLEGGKIKSVTVHVFDDEQALYEVLDLTDIPRNQIKLILLEKARKDYENAKEKFAYYLSEEHEKTIFYNNLRCANATPPNGIDVLILEDDPAK